MCNVYSFPYLIKGFPNAHRGAISFITIFLASIKIANNIKKASVICFLRYVICYFDSGQARKGDRQNLQMAYKEIGS